MSGGMIGNLLGNMDSQTAEAVLDSLDDEMIERALETGIEKEVVPHLEDVRENVVDDYPDAQQVRSHYESLPAEEQEQKFNKAAADILGVLIELRENPTDGLKKLKGRLREPYVIEALLLIFDHEGVPKELSDQRKEYAATWLRNAGVHVIPEVYEREEAVEVVEQMYPNSDPDEVLDGLDVGGPDESP